MVVYWSCEPEEVTLASQTPLTEPTELRAEVVRIGRHKEKQFRAPHFQFPEKIAALFRAAGSCAEMSLGKMQIDCCELEVAMPINASFFDSQ